jgi:hypothetical protein
MQKWKGHKKGNLMCVIFSIMKTKSKMKPM